MLQASVTVLDIKVVCGCPSANGPTKCGWVPLWKQCGWAAPGLPQLGAEDYSRDIFVLLPRVSDETHMKRTRTFLAINLSITWEGRKLWNQITQAPLARVTSSKANHVLSWHQPNSEMKAVFPSCWPLTHNWLLFIRTIVALVYNVLKTLMEMNGKLFDDLTSSYKAERQRYLRHCVIQLRKVYRFVVGVMVNTLGIATWKPLTVKPLPSKVILVF